MRRKWYEEMDLYMEEISCIKRSELNESNYLKSLIDNALSKKYIDIWI